MADTKSSEVGRSPWQRERTRKSELEERVVEVNDPQLSPELNAELTHEVREAVGAEKVQVPKDRPRPSHGEIITHRGFLATLSAYKHVAVMTFFFALILGAIIATTTNDWWVLVLAVGLHALATVVVTGNVMRLASTIEHPGPTVYAAMEEEGVVNPDETFSDIVAEFAPADEYAAPDADAVLSPGGNERVTDANVDPARATAEQAHSMTPSSGPSEPSPLTGAAPSLPWIVPAGLALISVLIPILASGTGWLWLVPAVVLPCVLGYFALQAALSRGLHLRMPLVIAATVTAVVIFGVVIAAIQV